MADLTREDLDRVEERVTDKVRTLHGRVDTHGERITALETKAAGMEKDMASVAEQVKNGTAELKRDLIEDRKAERDHQLEVLKLEMKQKADEAKLASDEADLNRKERQWYWTKMTAFATAIVSAIATAVGGAYMVWPESAESEPVTFPAPAPVEAPAEDPEP